MGAELSNSTLRRALESFKGTAPGMIGIPGSSKVHASFRTAETVHSQFSENSSVLFGGPRIIWRMKDPSGPIWRPKDHLVMQGLTNNVKNLNFKETHYSVRQNVGSTGSISMRNNIMFPLHPVTSKRPESPYGSTKIKFFSFSAHGGS